MIINDLIELRKIKLPDKKEHLALIESNKKSPQRSNDPSWRVGLDNLTYNTWLVEFNNNDSMGIFINHSLKGEVIFYFKDNRRFFGLWIDELLVDHGYGSLIIDKLMPQLKNTYVECLGSNQRVIHLFQKYNLPYNIINGMIEAYVE